MKIEASYNVLIRIDREPPVSCEVVVKNTDLKRE